jgi:hypothetical protein
MAMKVKRWIGIALLVALAVFVLALLFEKRYPPEDWSGFDVLRQKAPRPAMPVYYGKELPYDEYIKWVYWGEEWFRGETFGNERVWTDVVGLLNGSIDVPAGPGIWRSEPFFKYFLQAIDDLDGVRGNLYTGNGGGYTSDLVITFPPGCMLDKTLPIPEKLHTGLDVEAGSPWPLGIVPVRVAPEEESLSYLLDPGAYATGPQGVGPLPGGGKYRVGLSCALCHYSLDVDWDGKPDLKSAKPNEPTPNSPYRPEHAWAIGNQDIALGWIFASSFNTIAGFENSARVGTTSPDDARAWARWVRDNYETNAAETKREIDRGLLLFPRGFADDTPDGLHNPLQFPSLFTHRNWPYNYDGVMINASDRNNNVWTAGIDPTELIALCKDRGGQTAKLVFWEKKGLYTELTAQEYADIFVRHSPAGENDPAARERLRDDILGTSDGVPGMLESDAVAFISGVPNAIPKDIFQKPENKDRIREPAQFGIDGAKRGPMIGLLGTRVVTPKSIREKYNVGELESRYGLNGAEFVTEAVSMMLDWVEPPPNRSTLLANAGRAGLVDKGYDAFKGAGCADCHAGPYFTNNLIVPLEVIGTDDARAKATRPLQAFLAPQYDPRTGLAVSSGLRGIISKFFGGERTGYKVVTLRYLWGSAPYLHDGGVAVTLRPDSQPAGDDLQALLRRADSEKIYGVAQILAGRDANPASYLRANAALSLQAVLLESEREKVIRANQDKVYSIPGSPDRISIASIHIQGIGHKYWIQDEPGGDKITALVAFLLALDDDPSQHRQ